MLARSTAVPAQAPAGPGAPASQRVRLRGASRGSSLTALALHTPASRVMHKVLVSLIALWLIASFVRAIVLSGGELLQDYRRAQALRRKGTSPRARGRRGRRGQPARLEKTRRSARRVTCAPAAGPTVPDPAQPSSLRRAHRRSLCRLHIMHIEVVPKLLGFRGERCVCSSWETACAPPALLVHSACMMR